MIKEYHRKITEALPKDIWKSWLRSFSSKMFRASFKHFVAFVSAFIMVVLALEVIFMYFNYLSISEARQKSQDSLSYWEEVLTRHPNSPDAYYNAGKYALELGDRAGAATFLERAITLDPSFEKAKILAQQIDSVAR